MLTSSLISSQFFDTFSTFSILLSIQVLSKCYSVSPSSSIPFQYLGVFFNYFSNTFLFLPTLFCVLSYLPTSIVFALFSNLLVNTSFVDRFAIMSLADPVKSIISSATLWIINKELIGATETVHFEIPIFTFSTPRSC